jgi:hypothetical protein
MKLALTTLGLVACLVAAPMVAQDATAQDMSNADTAVASTELTGTVVSINDDTLVISTSEGEKTFKVSSLTTKPADLAVGSSVTVTYSDEAGEMVASNIVIDSGVADESAVAAAPATPPADTSASSTYIEQNTYESAAMDDADVDTDVSADLDADGDTDVAAGVDADADALPATASRIPLLALLGALSIGAALFVRRLS